MQTLATPLLHEATYPIRVHLDPALSGRNKLTVAFRPLLAIPHLLLVGGPMAAGLWWTWHSEPGATHEWGASGGALGAVAVVTAVIAWFAILFTGRHPDGLWNLAAFYLRWRVRAVAYLALLRDEYPPFGDGVYPASVDIAPPVERDALSVGFRIVLIIPHLIALWFLGFAWAVSTVIAWFAILFTGRFPEALYRFGAGMLRWNTRVEAYALLLRDEYPPFSLDS
jgi:Domain of unknown function (DUF4389)